MSLLLDALKKAESAATQNAASAAAPLPAQPPVEHPSLADVSELTLLQTIHPPAAAPNPTPAVAPPVVSTAPQSTLNAALNDQRKVAPATTTSTVSSATTRPATAPAPMPTSMPAQGRAEPSLNSRRTTASYAVGTKPSGKPKSSRVWLLGGVALIAAIGVSALWWWPAVQSTSAPVVVQAPRVIETSTAAVTPQPAVSAVGTTVSGVIATETLSSAIVKTDNTSASGVASSAANSATPAGMASSVLPAVIGTARTEIAPPAAAGRAVTSEVNLSANTARPAQRLANPSLIARAAKPSGGSASNGLNISRGAQTQTYSDTLQAYELLERGDLAGAKGAYRTAIASDRNNVDALLGLAIIAQREGDLQSAERGFGRALELDPRNAFAQTALLGLRSATDPAASENRIKSLLASGADSPAGRATPDNAVAYNALGNQLAAQGRWAQAQQAYFNAVSASPDNADFAYNLAVSLDQIKQAKAALQYYKTAQRLARTRAGAFNATDVERRVAELSAQLNQTNTSP